MIDYNRINATRFFTDQNEFLREIDIVKPGYVMLTPTRAGMQVGAYNSDTNQHFFIGTSDINTFGLDRIPDKKITGKMGWKGPNDDRKRFYVQVQKIDDQKFRSSDPVADYLWLVKHEESQLGKDHTNEIFSEELQTPGGVIFRSHAVKGTTDLIACIEDPDQAQQVRSELMKRHHRNLGSRHQWLVDLTDTMADAYKRKERDCFW